MSVRSLHQDQWYSTSSPSYAPAYPEYDPDPFSLNDETDNTLSGNIHSPCSSLDDLIEQLNWEGAVKRLATHPEEARHHQTRTVLSICSGKKGVRTALHEACAKHAAPLFVIRPLIKAYGEAAGMQDDMGRTPLHVACGHAEADAALVAELLHACPTAALLTDNTGRTPLHVFCCVSGGACIGTEVIEALLTACRGAALMRDNEGRTPLHLLCRCGRRERETVILTSLLLSWCPSAASAYDLQGNTPLHLACSRANGCSLQLIGMLLQTNPAVTSVCNNQGETPLERLCNYNNETLHVVETVATRIDLQDMLKQCYQLRQPNHCCNDPLVCLWQLVCLLLSSYKTDRENQPHFVQDGPLHACARMGSRCPNIVTRIALALHLEDMQRPDNDGNLPLHIAAATAATDAWSGSKKNVACFALSAFICAHPEAAEVKNLKGKLPLQLFLEKLETEKRRKTHWPEGVRALCEASMGEVARDSLSDDVCDLLSFFATESVPNTLLDVLRSKPELMSSGSQSSFICDMMDEDMEIFFSQ